MRELRQVSTKTGNSIGSVTSGRADHRHSADMECNVLSEACPKVERMFLPTVTPELELERLNPRERRYKIGQFFTPAPLAELLAEAVREVEPATVLDPGVGGGILLRAVGEGP